MLPLATGLPVARMSTDRGSAPWQAWVMTSPADVVERPPVGIARPSFTAKMFAKSASTARLIVCSALRRLRFSRLISSTSPFPT